MRPFATRSFAELKFVAYLLHSLDLLPKFRETLLRGDACLQSDAGIFLGECLCIFEFDPGYHHPPDRNDREKTLRLLHHYDTALVVRLRVDACDIVIDNPRCVIVHCRSASNGAMLVAAARAIAPHVPEPFRSRLLVAGSEKRPVAECAALDMWRELNPAFDDKCAAINSFLLASNLEGIDVTHLVGVPMHTMASAFAWLRSIGVKDTTIVAHPRLLRWNVATLETKRAWLHSIGVQDAKIATQPTLLCRDIATLDSQHSRLHATGVKDARNSA